MNIGRVRAAVVGLLGVLAVGATAATMDGTRSATSSGSGDGTGGGEGTGDGSAAGEASGDTFERAVSELTVDTWFPFGELFGGLIAIGTVFLVAYVGFRYWQDGADGLRELLVMSRDVIAGVGLVGAFGAVALWGFYRRFEPVEMPRPEAIEPGSLGQTAVDAASPSGGIDPVLIVLVVGGLVVVAGVLLALNRLNRGETGGDESGPTDEKTDENEHSWDESGAFIPGESVDDVEPSNEVYRAWLVLASSLDRHTVRTRTSTEVASRAIDAGFDRQTVSTITETFEEVRYGQMPVTATRESTARSALARLDDVDGDST